MKIAIDAINIKSDGGLAYLNEFLYNLDKSNIDKIYLLISKKTKITTKHKIIKIIENSFFDKNFLITSLWKLFFLDKFLKELKCQKLIVMSGHYLGNFNPTFLVIQNALPFSNEGSKYFPLVMKLKFFLQKLSHLISIWKKNNIIFVSHSIKRKVLKNFFSKKKYVVSYHAVNNQIIEKKKNKKIKKSILKLIYVSQYSYHKNHINLLDAIKRINKDEIKVTLDCYGQDLDNHLSDIKKFIKTSNIKGIKINNSIKQKNLFKVYKRYDCHIFPSHCESFGLPLVESAKAGLLIMCSNLEIFRELLKDSPVYFNQDSKNDIERALLKVIDMNNILFNEKIKKSLFYSKKYKWKFEVKKVKKFILSI